MAGSIQDLSKASRRARTAMWCSLMVTLLKNFTSNEGESTSTAESGNQTVSSASTSTAATNTTTAATASETKSTTTSTNAATHTSAVASTTTTSTVSTIGTSAGK